MKRILKVIGFTLAFPLLVLIGCIAADQVPVSRATPPKSVTDVASCLHWLKAPKGAYRITTERGVYYQITGPAGRYIASGPAGYSFDSHGRFIGWSSDIGDFKRPPEVFAPDAQRVRITLDELMRSL